MTPLSALRLLLNHIDRTSIQSDPEHLLVAISRQDVERAWSVVHAGDKDAERIAQLESQLADSREREKGLMELVTGARRAFAHFSDGPYPRSMAKQLYQEFDEALSTLTAAKEQE